MAIVVSGILYFCVLLIAALQVLIRMGATSETIEHIQESSDFNKWRSWATDLRIFLRGLGMETVCSSGLDRN